MCGQCGGGVRGGGSGWSLGDGQVRLSVSFLMAGAACPLCHSSCFCYPVLSLAGLSKQQNQRGLVRPSQCGCASSVGWKLKWEEFAPPFLAHCLGHLVSSPGIGFVFTLPDLPVPRVWTV